MARSTQRAARAVKREFNLAIDKKLHTRRIRIPPILLVDGERLRILRTRLYHKSAGARSMLPYVPLRMPSCGVSAANGWIQQPRDSEGGGSLQREL